MVKSILPPGDTANVRTPAGTLAPRPLQIGDSVVVERDRLGRLIDVLHEHGYEVVGPTVRDGAIVYDTLSGVADLPSGWTDEQAGGTYRLKRREDTALFGYTVGPQSWKGYLHPPVLTLWQAQRDEHGFTITPPPDDVPRRAFFGVRACELAAIRIQDRVFLEGAYVDPAYQSRRERSFIVAVNCGQAGNTCFCVSMGSGPRAEAGYDIALTEVLTPERHYFVADAGTSAGLAVLAAVDATPAALAETAAATDVTARAARQMGRTLDTTGLKDLLYANADHPRWDEVAARCLTCGNCTMVCPTCFCTTVEDVNDLTGQQAERRRRWDSCFTIDFSYIHGGSIRQTPKSRYRQWMTHKLASWVDQFGTAGCVGCGRCITWCPVGIDITEEAAAIRASAPAAAEQRE